MIKVEEISYKTYSNRFLYSNYLANRKQYYPTFQGKVPQIPETSLKDAIEYILPKSARILNGLGASGGEIQNIIINAIGTGFVAPIFIKYNFLSTADEDTRTYSAWRQPVSAFLAVVTQAGMIAPFYKVFDNWSNDGSFGENLNRVLFQDDYYIMKLIKKKYPNATKEQLDMQVKKQKELQRENLLRSLEEESTVYYTRADGSKVKMSDALKRNLLNETLDKLAKSDKVMLKEIDKTIEKRTARSLYYRSHNIEATNILKSLNRDILNSENINDLRFSIAEKIKSVKSDKSSIEMVKILEEVRSRAKVVSEGNAVSFSIVQEALSEKVLKMLEHVKKYQNVSSEAEVETMVKNIVAEEKNKLQKAINFYETLKNTITETTDIRELKTKIISKSKELKIEDSGLNKDFVEEVANQLISRTKSNMRWYKQFIGIFVSLGMLLITCTLLNYIYPRFMDVFFPNLSSKKHNKESAKLIDIATANDLKKDEGQNG